MWFVNVISIVLTTAYDTIVRKTASIMYNTFFGRREEDLIVEQVEQEDFAVEERRLLNKAVTHYHISSQGISPLDFLNGVRASVIRFVKERP